MSPTKIIHKLCDAELWVEAQKKFHYGECKSFLHRIFNKTHSIRSKQKDDQSSATLFLCNKCSGVRETWITKTYYL